MLPPGHIAAGYLVTRVVLYFGPQFAAAQHNELMLWGIFFSFAPDLDMFYTFYRTRRLTITDDDPSHREYYSHAPILWLLVGLGIYFLATDAFIKYVGLLLWIGSWTHFALDSIQHGVMWGWPLSRETYALKDHNKKSGIRESGFWRFWVKFIDFYATKMTLSFTVEISLVILAIALFLW